VPNQKALALAKNHEVQSESLRLSTIFRELSMSICNLQYGHEAGDRQLFEHVIEIFLKFVMLFLWIFVSCIFSIIVSGIAEECPLSLNPGGYNRKKLHIGLKGLFEMYAPLNQADIIEWSCTIGHVFKSHHSFVFFGHCLCSRIHMYWPHCTLLSCCYFSICGVAQFLIAYSCLLCLILVLFGCQPGLALIL